MLVLHRESNESVTIGEHISVTVMEQHGGGIRLAVDAPQEIRVMRSELHDAVRHQNLMAASIRPERIEELDAYRL